MKVTFMKQLKDAIDASGYTQKKAAQALHISPQTLSAYLHGRSTPDIELFDLIVRMFAIDVTKVFDSPDYSSVSDIEMMNIISKLDKDQKMLIRAVLFYFKTINKE